MQANAFIAAKASNVVQGGPFHCLVGRSGPQRRREMAQGAKLLFFQVGSQDLDVRQLASERNFDFDRALSLLQTCIM